MEDMQYQCSPYEGAIFKEYFDQWHSSPTRHIKLHQEDLGIRQFLFFFPEQIQIIGGSYNWYLELYAFSININIFLLKF